MAWAATSGATNAGAVFFSPSGSGKTTVRLSLEYDPEGLVEKAGDALNLIARQAESDPERFKAFVEGRGVETGAWRGSINEQADMGTPGVEEAAGSRGARQSSTGGTAPRPGRGGSRDDGGPLIVT